MKILKQYEIGLESGDNDIENIKMGSKIYANMA